MNSSIFGASFFRAIVLLFVPAIAMAQIPEHCYVPGARLVRYYNLNEHNDSQNTHIDYYYDRQGNCRIVQQATIDDDQRRAEDTVYYDAQMRMLSRLKDGSLALKIDKEGQHVTTIAALNPQLPYISAEQHDSKGNWTRGIAYHENNPEMKHEAAVYERVKRDIEYYGTDTKADAAFTALMAKIDNQIGNTAENKKYAKQLNSVIEFRKGFFGLLLFGVLFPFLRSFFIFGIPVMIASAIPAIPNWLLRAGAVLYGLSFISGSFSGMSSYGHSLEQVVAGIVYLGGTLGLYLGIVQKRCPQCHRSNSKVTRTITRSLKIKRYRQLPNGDQELVDSSTSTDYDDDHRCYNCGYEWQTTRDF